jgi:hypothetical protein
MAKLEDFPFRHDGIFFCLTMEAQEWPAETARLGGSKIFKDVEVLNALIPGSKNQANSDLVTQDLIDRKGIREFYNKWKSGVSTNMEGRPLRDLDELTGGQIKTLEAANIRSLEAVAELDDSLLSILGPQGRALRDKARVKIGFTADEGVKALRAENAALNAQMEEMRKQIAALASPVVAVEEAEPVKSRKPKAVKDPHEPFATETA